MKAITVRQPWAWAIIAGHKDVENRAWKPGPILGQRIVIHASTHFASPDARDTIATILGHEPPDGETWARGCHLGTVRLTGVHRCRDCNSQCSPWAQPDPEGHPGTMWHWTLADPEPFDTPLPGVGRLGLWTVPAAIERGRNIGMFQ